MPVVEKTKSLNEIKTVEDINRIMASGNEIVYINPKSDWQIDRVFTDFHFGEHEEIIVIFRRKIKEK